MILGGSSYAPYMPKSMNDGRALHLDESVLNSEPPDPLGHYASSMKRNPQSEGGDLFLSLAR